MKRKFLIIVLVGCFLMNFNQVSAFSWSDLSPSNLFLGLDTLVNQITNVISFLAKQKDYLIGKKTDVNSYDNLSRAPDIEKVVTDLGGTTTSESKPSFVPIQVSTSTLPEVKNIATSTKVSPKIPDISLPPVINLGSTTVKTVTANFISSGDYTSTDILIFTNKERTKESLLPLSSNKTLDQVAKLKLEDLFSKQYFAHESPTGQSAADLAKQAGYNYLMVGENLALGNFGDNQGIVSAWMDSPGHRANILNPKFKELGVALRQGKFENRNVTIAVQIFGNPQTACAKPSQATQKLINDSSASIKKAETQAQIMYTSLIQIKSESELDLAYYNQKIQEYNYYAKNINTAIMNLKRVTSEFNQQVAIYNNCISH